jgi:7,8-dihydropterin-6-yl-methyl-4-(beta-D-ribofuranosyl)aminobenzene 5'-phosphate synthase
VNKSIIIFILTIISATTLFAANFTHDSKGGREQMHQIEPNNVISDSNKVNITIIYDNNPFKEGLETAWGFSCLITGTERTILFDTGGDGVLLLENMKKLAIEPNSIELVVLSHEHWDHVGGMEMFLEKNHDVSVYMPVSFPQDFKKMVTNSGAKIIETEKPTEICRGVYSTGQLGTSIKEQGLIIRTDKGVILITGCAHPGIVKMTQKTKEIFNEQILFVMGGFHLSAASDSQIKEIIEAFKDLKVEYAAPCHCSGDNARALFAEQFDEKYLNIGVGLVIAIKNLK